MTSRLLALLAVVAAPLLTGCGAKAGPLPECVVATDCPSTGDECLLASCERSTCSYAQAPEGTLVGVQPDCQARYCDARGLVHVDPSAANCQPEVSDALPMAPVEPDGPVVLHGRHLFDAVVSVGGIDVAATASPDGTSASFTPPPAGTYSQVSLRVTTPFGTFTHPTGFSYSLRRTRALVADGDLGDWSLPYAIDRNVAPTDRSPDDRLGVLYAAYDTAGLWIGLDGGTATSPANGLVIYVDTQGSRVEVPPAMDLSTLIDNGSPLSDACSSSLRVDQYAWFLPSACAGTVGMASVAAGQGAPATGSAGLRWLSPASHFDWRLGPGGVSQVTVATALAPEAVELFLPWSALGLAPHPPDASVIELAIRIVSPDGQSISNQYLPYTADPPNVTGGELVFVLW